MATVTSTVAVNAAFLQEIKDDHQELWALLGEVRALCQPAALRNTAPGRLCDLLERLRDRVAMHFALEEAYGYFDDAVAVAPRLSQEADLLRGEHSDLFLELCRIAELADGLRHHQAPVWKLPNVARRFQHFDARLQEHEAREHELIQKAFQQDLGVGD